MVCKLYLNLKKREEQLERTKTTHVLWLRTKKMLRAFCTAGRTHKRLQKGTQGSDDKTGDCLSLLGLEKLINLSEKRDQ